MEDRHFFANGRPATHTGDVRSFLESLEPRGQAAAAPPRAPSRPAFESLLGVTKEGVQRRLVCFDGRCRLCLGFVSLVANRDEADAFRFAPLQSDVGQQALGWHGLPKDLDSVVLHREGTVYIRSSAALEILGELGGAVSALYAFSILPCSLRDWGYELVAKSRFWLLGHTTVSESADEAIKQRLVDTWEPDPNDPAHDCSS